MKLLLGNPWGDPLVTTHRPDQFAGRACYLGGLFFRGRGLLCAVRGGPLSRRHQGSCCARYTPPASPGVGAHHFDGFAHRDLGVQGADVALAKLCQAKAGFSRFLARDARVDLGWGHEGLLWHLRHGAASASV